MREMTKIEWRVRMALGWMAFRIVMALPVRLSPLWLVAHAGFYAHDNGYENFIDRVRSLDPPEAKP